MNSHWLSTNKTHSLYEASGFFSTFNALKQHIPLQPKKLLLSHMHKKTEFHPKSPTANYYKWRERTNQPSSVQKDAKPDIITRKKKKKERKKTGIKKESYFSKALAADLAAVGRTVEILGRYLPCEHAGQTSYMTLLILPLPSLTSTPRMLRQSKRRRPAHRQPVCSSTAFHQRICQWLG